MEKYVVSRELAEKLKEAGYPQSSRFAWIPEEQADEITYFADNDGYLLVMEKGLINYYHDTGESLVAAPLSDELLEQLPSMHVFVKKMTHLSRIDRSNDHIDYEAWHEILTKDYMGMERAKTEFADKPADALAQLWLWCKAEGYIQNKEVM